MKKIKKNQYEGFSLRQYRLGGTHNTRVLLSLGYTILLYLKFIMGSQLISSIFL